MSGARAIARVPTVSPSRCAPGSTRSSPTSRRGSRRNRDPAMRLLQAMGGARHGGAEGFFLRLALALQRAGRDQLVLLRHAEHAATLREGGVAARELPFGGFFDRATAGGFPRAIVQYPPDIVLTLVSPARPLFPAADFLHV